MVLTRWQMADVPPTNGLWPLTPPRGESVQKREPPALSRNKTPAGVSDWNPTMVSGPRRPPDGISFGLETGDWGLDSMQTALEPDASTAAATNKVP